MKVWITIILLAISAHATLATWALIKAIANEVGLGPGVDYVDGSASPHFQVDKQAYMRAYRPPQARARVAPIDYCCIDSSGLPRSYPPNPQNWE
uniref:Uncharacterized protein n=1 Tax=Glossina palpalis gambiensis TaxID=67801 RepID=A0A1B0AU43_9MUSC